MKFLTNWTIDLRKLSDEKYTAFNGDFVMQLDYAVLQMMYDSKYITDDQRTDLKPILKKIDKKTGKLKCKHHQASGIGRYYATHKISPICVSRIIKHTLFTYLDWIDIDMVKGHPTIIKQIALKNGYATPEIDKYLANPDATFKTLLKHYATDDKLTEDDVKDIFNLAIYGGGHSTWLKQMVEDKKNVNQQKHPIVKAFITEVRAIANLVYKSNQNISDRVASSCNYDCACQPSCSLSEYKKQGRVMSYWCGVIENHIVHLTAKMLIKEKWIIPKQFGQELDGFCFKNLGFDADAKAVMTKKINDMIVEKTGLAVTMKFKEYKEEKICRPILEARMKLENDPPAVSESEADEEQTFIQETFDDIALAFEENHQKIINKGFFVKTTSEEIVTMSKTHLITAYENITYIVQSKQGLPIIKNFINDWIHNNNKQKCYHDLGCYPHDIVCPENIYNTWTPFAMENISEYTEMPAELEIIKKHILIMCNHDKKVAHYFTLWIAQLIRCPSRKSNMPLLQSAQGGGKSTLILILTLMLGIKKVFSTRNPSRDVWGGGFNGQMSSAFLVVLDEISKKETIASDGEIKGLITEPTLTINKKGVPQFEIQSYHRFIATTNNTEPMGTTEDDRRKWFIKSSDELVGNKKYFDDFYKMLEDTNVVKTCYEYFKALTEADTFHLLPLPKTEFAKDLCSLSRSPIQHFLEDFVLGINKVDEFGNYEILSSSLFELFKKWKFDNDVKYDVSNISFGLRLKNLKINGISIKKKVMSKGYNGYEFNISVVKKHLGVGLLINVK